MRVAENVTGQPAPVHDETYGINIMVEGRWKPKKGKTTQNITKHYAMHHLKEYTRAGNLCQVTKDGDRVLADNTEIVLGPESMAYLDRINYFMDGIKRRTEHLP